MKGIQFVVDETGQKTAVLLDLMEWSALWDALHTKIMAATNQTQSPQERAEEARFGSDAARISIAADFDEPLVDFQDYR